MLIYVFLWGSEACEVRASTESGVYFMRRPEKWPRELNSARKIKEAREKIASEVREKYESLYQQGKISKIERHRMSSDETNRRFCEKYGIVYGKEKFEE